VIEKPQKRRAGHARELAIRKALERMAASLIGSEIADLLLNGGPSYATTLPWACSSV
jgi:hypothetical protein